MPETSPRPRSSYVGLIGIIAPDNTTCHRVVEKIGFRREKVVRHEGTTSLLFSADPLEAYLSSGLPTPGEDPTGNSGQVY